MNFHKLIKNLIKIRIVLFVLLLSFGLSSHQAHGNNEYEYTNLNITANIKIDGTINVLEDFTANFHIQKHGIIREIPLNYSVDGQPFHINLKKIKVKGKKYSTSTENGTVSIKIGKVNKTVVGTQDYPISYSVYGLIRNFSGMGYAELYWNIVGNQFDTSINKVKAELILPKAYTGFTSEDFFITTDGKSNKLEDFEGSLDWSQGDRIILTYDKGLPSYQGITLAIKFPNNYFKFNHNKQKKLISNNQPMQDKEFLIGNKKLSTIGGHVIISKISNYFVQNPPSVIIGKIKNSKFISKITSSIIFYFILTFFNSSYDHDISLLALSISFVITIFIIKFIFKHICIFLKSLLGRFFKKKHIGGYSIITQYNPPKGISPSEMSYLYFKSARSNAISCMIHKRACEGNISISYNEGESSITITQIKKPSNLTGIELSCWLHLPRKSNTFSYKDNINGEIKKIAKLPNVSFSKNIININKGIKNFCKNKGWISRQKRIRRVTSFIFCLLSIYIIIASEISDISLIVFSISIISSYIINKKASHIKYTDAGNKILAEIYGYKYFLEACEENQIRTFLNEDPNFINKVLPYATALGLETKLMKMVTPIYEEKGQNLTWYNGNLDSISSAMNNISKSSVGYSPSDSGGGSYSSNSGHSSGSSVSNGGISFFSGGGGGGGGGRSW